MTRPKRMEEVVDDVAKNIEEASMPVDKEKLPHMEYAPQSEILRAQKKNAKKIVPLFSLKVKTMTPLNEERHRYRDYMWEYVEGICENRSINGETVKFFQNPFPGDDSTYWEIPVGINISVPRWVAKHLSTRSYVKFKHKEKPEKDLRPDDFMHNFVPDEVLQRTTFMATGMY